MFPPVIDMQIEIQDEPYYSLSYLNAGTKREGQRWDALVFLRGRITGLPEGMPALVAMGDLQGRSDFGDAEETLLGVAVAEMMPEIQEAAGLPSPFDCPVFLAGDFYTVPNAAKRGGTGNVRLVWDVLREVFASVCGVAGNHDTFTDSPGGASPHSRPPRECLDGQVIAMGNLRIGGVSGSVSGRESLTLQKKDEASFLRLLNAVLVEKPDILVLHTPPFVDDRHVGSTMVTDTLVSYGFSGLVLCGHCPWPERVRTVGRATVLNVHEAVVTLTT